MKIRTNFVSNSSSSSFIIYIPLLNGNEKDIVYNLIDLKQKESNWGSSGNTFKLKNNYLCIETFYVTKDIEQIFKKYNLDINTIGFEINE